MTEPSDAELIAWLRENAEYCRLRKDDDDARFTNAADRLAALTAAGAWTSEPPKVPGWWWFKPTDGRSPFVVRVSVWPGGGLAYYDDKEGETLVPGQMPGEWRGPLSPATPPPVPAEVLAAGERCRDLFNPPGMVNAPNHHHDWANASVDCVKDLATLADYAVAELVARGVLRGER